MSGDIGWSASPCFLNNLVSDPGMKVMNFQNGMSAIVLLFLLMMGRNGQAQEQPSATVTPILFDPSFWRDELRLNGSQCLRMQEINKEFYDHLLMAFREKSDDKNALRSAFEQCWFDRNRQLWETMSARQQKKWKKIAAPRQQELEVNKVTSLFE